MKTEKQLLEAIDQLNSLEVPEDNNFYFFTEEEDVYIKIKTKKK